MKTRAQKEEIISHIADRVSRSAALYLADFTGMTVAEETQLRGTFRKAGVDYTVAKNTLIRKALERVSGYDVTFKYLVGPTALLVSYDDITAPAKILKESVSKGGKIKLKAAVVEKAVYDGAQLDALASLPSRKELVSSIMGSLQAPASGIVNVINAVFRDLVVVVDEIGKKKAA